MDLSFLDPQLYSTTDAAIHFQIRAFLNSSKLAVLHHNQLLQQNQALLSVMKDIRTILCNAHNVPNNFTDPMVPLPAYPKEEEEEATPQEQAAPQAQAAQ